MPPEPAITLTHLVAIAGVTLVVVGFFANQFRSRLDLQARQTAETIQRHGDLAVSFAKISGTIEAVEARLTSRIDLVAAELKTINGRVTRTEDELREAHLRMLNLLEVSSRVSQELLEWLQTRNQHQDQAGQ